MNVGDADGTPEITLRQPGRPRSVAACLNPVFRDPCALLGPLHRLQ